jgi:proteasome lid subunit RPN8/RPN11
MDNLTIPKSIYDEMLAHCSEAYPNEACGILAGIGNKVTEIYTMTNIEHSPVSYALDSKEHFRVIKDMRERGISMLAVFHSHPSSQAYPSPKDVSLAFYEDAVYLIVSLFNKEPVVKGFSIREAGITEVQVDIS